MKLKIAFFLLALCLCGGVFVGCTNEADPVPAMHEDSDTVGNGGNDIERD